MKRSLKLFSSFGIVATLALTLTGCPTQATLAALTQTLGTSAAQVATLEGNSALGSQLLGDTNAAVSAIDNWKSGSSAQNAIQALNVVEADLSLFPVTSQYAPLIDLSIGTAEAIISLLPASTSSALQPAARPVRHVQLTHPAPKTSSDFKKQWDAIVAQNPTALGKAKI